MTIKELGEICKKNGCDRCEYKNYCFKVLPEVLRNISPAGLLKILDREVYKS